VRCNWNLRPVAGERNIYRFALVAKRLTASFPQSGRRNPANGIERKAAIRSVTRESLGTPAIYRELNRVGMNNAKIARQIEQNDAQRLLFSRN